MSWWSDFTSSDAAKVIFAGLGGPIGTALVIANEVKSGKDNASARKVDEAKALSKAESERLAAEAQAIKVANASEAELLKEQQKLAKQQAKANAALEQAEKAAAKRAEAEAKLASAQATAKMAIEAGTITEAQFEYAYTGIGAVAGAAAGFWLGGPVGAVVGGLGGGGAGYLVTPKIEEGGA